jgi:hypothetical protein
MKIGVYGSAAGSIPNEVKRSAKEIGRQIARRECTLVTGGCPGLPYDAVLGAHELGGRCIGYSPATDLEAHTNLYKFPVSGFSEFVFVPKDVPKEYVDVNNTTVCKKYRNVASVAAIDAAIIIGGRIGTMNEFTLAYDFQKNIGILKGSGGITKEAIKILLRDIDKPSASKIIYDVSPISLVDGLVELQMATKH